jgi:hypothetical protein
MHRKGAVHHNVTASKKSALATRRSMCHKGFQAIRETWHGHC